MSARFQGIAGTTRALNGVPEYLGTIAATTTGVDNGNTGTPFTIPTGAAVVIQTDAQCYISPQAKSAATPPANSAAFLIDVAPATLYMVFSEALPFLCARTASGTASVKVFRIK